MGVAAGMPGGGGAACPCAEGAVDPRSAAAAAWRAPPAGRMASEKIEKIGVRENR